MNEYYSLEEQRKYEIIGTEFKLEENMNYGVFTMANMLHTKGCKIYNARNEQIFLRGTNLGGWLLQEDWMAATKGIDSQWELIEKLAKRFGEEKRDNLINAWEDNFITVYDIDLIKNYAFNCVRDPFWYRNFMLDDEGTYRRKADGIIDFSRLDWVVEECGKRGIYVVLDMHGVPGFQSVAHHSGRCHHCELYDDTPRGEFFRNLAVDLWQRIAAHFKGNPIVCMYDLMNEPMCDNEPKISSKYVEVYNLLYKAVRAVDPEHIITIEGIWTPLDLPPTAKYGWTNVVYQYHLYEHNNEQYISTAATINLPHSNVPVLIGEFCPCRGSADWATILNAFNKAGLHWLTWTYKGFSKTAPTSDWFIMGTSGDKYFVDIENDSYETILEKWTNLTATKDNYFEMADGKLLGSFA